MRLATFGAGGRSRLGARLASSFLAAGSDTALAPIDDTKPSGRLGNRVVAGW